MKRPWLSLWLNAAAIGVVLWLYGWMATANQDPFDLKGPKSDYFNRLTDAFLAGHVHLLEAPHPHLLHLPDPYDPAQNASYRQLDVSLYRGQYYLYNGPTPVLTLFLPWTVLARGNDLPLNLAIFIFCAVAFLVAVALFRRLARRHFSESTWAQGPLPILLLGLGNFCVILLRRSMHYEASIAAAYCWLVITLYLLFRATELGARCRWWLGLGSLAGGLTIGARPNQSFAVLAALAGTFLFMWWRTLAPPRRYGRSAAVLGFAAFGPAGLVVTGLLAYNYVRFGNPFEFGMTYALSAFSLRHWRPFRLAFLPANLRLYLLSPPGLDLVFPYVRPTDTTAIHFPAGYSTVEAAVGILSSLPVLWLTPFAFLSASQQSGRWRLLAGVLLAGGLASLLVLASLGGASVRYEVDFLPPFVLLAALGALAVYQREIARRWWRRAVRGAVNLLIVAAVLFNLAFAVRHLDLLKILNPPLYQRLAAVGNQPLLLWERLTGVQHGPVRLTVRFPAGQAGRSEPLLATGGTRGRDMVLVRYPDDRHVEFQLFHEGAGGPTSLPIPLDYSQDHTVEIAMGSLLPVAGSAFYRTLTREETENIRRIFAVKLDGRPVVTSNIDFYEIASHQVYFGVSPVPGGGKFSGVIRSIEHLPARDLLLPAPGPQVGPLRLQIRLPAPSPGLVEPLVATGRPGAGNVLYVVFEDKSHIRLGFDQSAQGTLLSNPITVDYRELHTIELTAGSLFPPESDPFFAGMSPADRAGRRSTLQVRLDGKLIIYKLTMNFAEIPFGPPVVGYNSVRSSACGASFTGLIVAQTRLGHEWFAPPELTGAAYGPISVNVVFPSGRTGRQEPLVVTGRPGRGDFIYVIYLDATHIRVGFDHWGVAGVISDPIAVGYDQACTLAVSMGSLFPPLTDPRMTALPAGEADRLKHTVRVRLNNRVVLNATRDCYDADPAEVSVGMNPIGGSTCDTMFNGTIQASERESLVPPQPGSP